MKLVRTLRGSPRLPAVASLGPATPSVSSEGLGWDGFSIHSYHVDEHEIPERIDQRYFLGLWQGNTVHGEHRRGRGAFVRFTRHPGTMTLVPPGLIPETHAYSPISVTLCVLDAQFVASVRDELDQRPPGMPGFHPGMEDEPLRKLIWLLRAEAKDVSALGRLYAEHLAYALVGRLYCVQFGIQEKTRSESAVMPAHLLRRVIERMHDLHSDLGLNALAEETGYSRAHFLRMFRGATGLTPHQYILRLRLGKAQELLRQPRPSLIDIAATCGFSSHAHLSRAFRQMLGMTPTEYRRAL